MVCRSISEEFTIDRFGKSVHPILIDSGRNVKSTHKFTRLTRKSSTWVWGLSRLLVRGWWRCSAGGQQIASISSGWIVWSPLVIILQFINIISYYGRPFRWSDVFASKQPSPTSHQDSSVREHMGVRFERSFSKSWMKALVQKVSGLYHHLTTIHRLHIGCYPTVCARHNAFFHCFTSELHCCEYVDVEMLLADLFGALWIGTTARSKRESDSLYISLKRCVLSWDV